MFNLVHTSDRVELSCLLAAYVNEMCLRLRPATLLSRRPGGYTV